MPIKADLYVHITYFNVQRYLNFWDDLERGPECPGSTLGLIGPC